MPTALQFRRGTTSQNNSFTGAVGEISVDTTLDTLRIHDGSAAGGFEITSNAAAQTLTNKTLTTPVIAEIDSGSTITLDATTDIVLDADGGDIFFKDAGTTFGSATNASGNLIIKSGTTTAATFSGANVTLAGTVASGAITSSSTVTATQGIFSNASPLVFEGSTADSFETTIAVTDPTADRTITIPNATDTLVGRATTDTLTNKTLTTPVIAEIDSSGNLTLDAETDIILDANGGDVFLKDDGTTYGSLTNTGGNLIIKSGTTTAMTMSGANVTIAGNLTIQGSTTTVDSSTVNLQTGFVFEGATSDSFETTLVATDPTADRTLTLPDLTGTVSLITATETLTNKTLTTPVIAEIDSGSTITLDAATDIVLDAAGNNITLKTAATTALDFVLNGATDVTLDAPGDIKIDADGGDVFLLDDGTTYGSLTNTSGNLIIKSGTTTAATFSGANVTLAGTVGSGAITSSSTVTATGFVNTGTMVFEGSTADSFETTLGVVDPTADRTVNVANAAGTLQPFATASTTAISTTVDELNLIDGGTARGTTAIADGDGVLINDAGTMRMTTVQTLAAYLDDEITAMPNLVGTGALNSGTITSGFGNIDTGSSTITTTGLISGGSLDIDNVLINGTTIGHTDDTDLLTLADGALTVAGTVGSGAITSTGTVTATGFVNTGSIVFEGSTADSFETTLGVVDPTADRAVNIANAAGTLQPFAVASTDAISTTVAEVNLIDGGTSRGTTAVADGDGLLTNDAGTMRMTNVQTFDTYFAQTTKTLTNKTLTSPNIGTSIELLARAEARFQDASGGQFVGLEAPATVSSSFVLTLPAADGSAGQFLKTDGSGALAFGSVSSAADDLTAGDAAINLTTTSGNIVIDAAANDSDIILKGTDGNADTTFLTIDGSAAGAAAFNDAVTATSFTSTGASTFDGVNITEDGTLVFEGASNNSFETTITVTDPTADRTVTFPNETFKVASYANKAVLDGDGSETEVTIVAGYDVDQFLVTINGIVQEPTEDFTISGTTLTLDAAPASGDRVVVRF